MKIKIKKELLLENLNKVSKAISTKNLIPILSGIKFDLTKEGLTLTASDNDITIQTFIPVDNKDMEILTDYETRKTIKLSEVLPNWWGNKKYSV